MARAEAREVEKAAYAKKVAKELEECDPKADGDVGGTGSKDADAGDAGTYRKKPRLTVVPTATPLTVTVGETRLQALWARVDEFGEIDPDSLRAVSTVDLQPTAGLMAAMKKAGPPEPRHTTKDNIAAFFGIKVPAGEEDPEVMTFVPPPAAAPAPVQMSSAGTPSPSQSGWAAGLPKVSLNSEYVHITPPEPAENGGRTHYENSVLFKFKACLKCVKQILNVSNT
jgi:hypothetical protein